ncbi:GNAT family N-acetyltransferase [Staphylococcus pasteuri]|uniref:N-acetyltransferase n=1 Tax=Staphylococcus pasteuri TaxID=45972 RepID=A0ABY1H0F1_9STAP|nr:MULTISPECIES: GNAT family N-acetyltransferase [Staphylococcus]RQX27449.1 N-acetyltransferase [Staphylococcus warneri]ATH61808.1 GNAT family N-acetyltransferase [Staphylococcus pasteuri]KKI56108.1 acetyltransferase (GNAT) family protein [Staphylococcus pasteuri]MBL3399107.1 N-acetyltransferase [Staphylococcus pasteuri]MBM6507996.1 N-acetyltransferase [Staphylococcus pasteuri]
MAEEIKQGTNKFYVGEDENDPKAVITFKTADNNEIDIDHTGVSDELGGQGLGKKLVYQVVDYARKNNLKIIASCPFAKDVLEKDDSVQDVYLG